MTKASAFVGNSEPPVRRHTMVKSTERPKGSKIFCDGVNNPKCTIGFPHYIITIPANPGVPKKGRKSARPAIPEMRFNVCAQCDHWIARRMIACDCPKNCHDEARRGNR